MVTIGLSMETDGDGDIDMEASLAVLFLGGWRDLKGVVVLRAHLGREKRRENKHS